MLDRPKGWSNSQWGLGLRIGVGMLDRPKGWSRDGVGDRDGLSQLGMSD